jgi:hypothetical protein
VTRRAADGDGLIDIFAAALDNLEAHSPAINALNIFPVPDGDTGSNMLATMRAALAEARQVPAADRTAGAVAGAIGYGALMGARGNSGVILSQILRGFAEALGDHRRMGALDFAHALSVGSRTAEGAVLKPVEGTILTVVRDSAHAAVEAAELDSDLEGVMAAAVEAAEESVARTPFLLPILREAGVVDAGGEGLYRILQGGLRGLLGWPSEAELMLAAGLHAAPSGAAVIARAEEGYGYETMLLVSAGHTPLDLDAIRCRLETIGESVVVAGDTRAAKLHVHNQRPDEVLAYALSVGSISHVNVENLDRQAREVRLAQGHALTGHQPIAPTATAPPARVTPLARPTLVEAPAAVTRSADSPSARPDHDGPCIIAVATGDGLASVFASFGVAEIVSGGQGANPSTGEILRAAQRIDGREILLLPNNPNVKLAAEQAAALYQQTPIVVVPTRNAAEGFAALLVFDPSLSAQGNAGPMLAAARSIQTLQVTDAVRDAKVNGRRVKKGQTIVLDPDDGLVAVDSDRTAAIVAAVSSLQPGSELLTLYYGDGADLAEAESLGTALRHAVPGVEVEVLHGGQPHYRYLVSAE